MDRKQQQLIHYYYDRFAKREFDEKEVLGFLTIAGSDPQFHALAVLKEFILTRHTDTPAVKEYFEHAHDIISRLGSGGPKEKINLLFTFKDVRNGLNQYFSAHKLEKLSTDAVSDFLVCVISLLQSIPIHRGKNRRSSGSLCFGASQKELLLMGTLNTTVRGRSVPVTFPVLTVKNEYEKVQKQDTSDSPYLFETTVADIVSTEGKLIVTFPEIPVKA